MHREESCPPPPLPSRATHFCHILPRALKSTSSWQNSHWSTLVNAEVDFWERQFSVSDKNHFGKYFKFANNVYLPSLRSKRFRSVSKQRNTEEGDFRFWPREKWIESQKVKEGGGGGEGRKGFLPSFPAPSPLFYLSHFSRGLWLSFLVLFS